MKTSDFFFKLPENLIAQYPAERRGESRLMLLDRVTGKREHRMVRDLPEILCRPEFRGKDGALPLLVFNDSKVRKARIVGTALQSGAKAEFLLLERMGTGDWKALVQRAKRRKTGSVYVFHDKNGAEAARAEITGGENEFRFLVFDRSIDDDWLERCGHIPLPPYIKRQDAPLDADRYQTVYAAAAGSAAAPTAGLHFTRELLGDLAAAGIESAFVTLHVGLGTFLPVRSENIEDHVMHEESFSINKETAAKIEKAKADGRKVIAIGTTSVRVLETATPHSLIPSPQSPIPPQSLTNIYIYPGYQFNTVDALLTNFHTPESTLLMLVSAFAGRELILESYAEAIREGYRFFSYGDAMLIS